MRTVLFALTALNSMLLVLLLGHGLPAIAGAEPPMLRGSGLEIVDATGRVRASIGILPSAAQRSGATTVLLRLVDEAGQPSVKIGADGALAGISLVGGDDESYILLQADGAESSLRIVEADGTRTLSVGPS